MQTFNVDVAYGCTVEASSLDEAIEKAEQQVSATVALPRSEYVITIEDQFGTVLAEDGEPVD